MQSQLSKPIRRVLPIVALILTAVIFFANSHSDDRAQSWRIVKAFTITQLLKQPDYLESYTGPSGLPIEVSALQLLQDTDTQTTAFFTIAKLLGCPPLFGFLWFMLHIFCKSFTKTATQRKVSSANMNKVVDASKLSQLTARNPSMTQISLSGIQMPNKTDSGNIIVTGGSGSGKTVCIKELLSSIRKAGKKAIIYDVNGDMISHFYRNGKDIILNPLDSRSASWDIWCECTRRHDYMKMASALIPDHSIEKEFSRGARIVLARIAEKLAENEEASTKNLIKQLRDIDNSKITNILEDTDGASILARWEDKACISIRGILLSCIEPLKELNNDNFRFSVRRWTYKDNDDSWLFISTHADEMDILRPLTTVWLDFAANTLMGLPGDHLRRVFFVVDDLTSVNNIPSLPNLMLKSKHTGACSILGIDSYNRLLDIYGSEDTQSMTRACENWVVFKSTDHQTANWNSLTLGSKVSIEKTEVTYQGHDEKQILQRQINTPLVRPSDVATLPELHGYLRFSQDYPVGKFNSVAKDLNKVAAPFSPRVGLESIELNTEVKPQTPANKPDINEDQSLKEPEQKLAV